MRRTRLNLASLGVQKRGKRVAFGKNGARALQIIGRNATLIHPLSQAFVPDELDNADRFLNGRILLERASKFAFVDQHERSLCLSLARSMVAPLSQISKGSKDVLPSQIPNKERPFIPGFKSARLSGPFSVNRRFIFEASQEKV